MKNSLSRKILIGTLATSLLIMPIADAAAVTKTIDLTYGGTSITLNGANLSLKTSASKAAEVITYNNQQYIPAKVLASALSLTLSYDSKTNVLALKGTLPSSTASTTQSTVSTTGAAPTGTPPTGTPPTGTPPTGTPPTGTPPAKPEGSTATDAVTTATKTQTNTAAYTNQSATTSDAGKTTATQVVIEKSTAVKQKSKVTFGGVALTLNGKTLTLKDSYGKTQETMNYNGTLYIPVASLEKTFNLKTAYNKTTGVLSLTGQSTMPSSTSNQGTAPGGQSTATITGTAVKSISSDAGVITGETYTATKSNESAIIVTKGGELTLSDSTIQKSGDSTSEETSNFNGLNAGILTENGGQLTLKNVIINTDSDGSNAVVSTGNGSTINIEKITISTTKNSSRGLHATYTGVINATDVNIHTLGDHSGALTTDRGEGTVTVTNGTLITEGDGSPGVYSTGTIKGTNLVSTAKGSEAAVIEGKNSITLIDSILYGAKKWGVMIYQSFSGDAGTGTGTFTMTGGSIEAAVGPMFYSTNTNGIINLSKVKLTNPSGILLQADGNNQWGTKGSNGANIVFNANDQILEGKVIADAISTVILNLSSNSNFVGSVNSDAEAKSVSVNLSADSTWTLTSNSYVSVITDQDATLVNIKDQGFNIYYDASNSSNTWLAGKTITLSGGGKLMPK